jgi:hypothetical protein
MKLPPPLPSGAATMTDVQAVAIAGRSSRRGRRGEEAIADNRILADIRQVENN